MQQFDGILRVYAETGLRTLEDWLALRRDVISGSKPRVQAVQNGETVPLYTRDQTNSRVSPRRR